MRKIARKQFTHIYFAYHNTHTPTHTHTHTHTLSYGAVSEYSWLWWHLQQVDGVHAALDAIPTQIQLGVGSVREVRLLVLLGGRRGSACEGDTTGRGMKRLRQG